MNIWHHHLGHISAERVIQMVREGAVEGMSFISSDSDMTLCGLCQPGKHCCNPITKEPHVIHPTNCFHDSRDANFDKDSASTSERIRFKSDPCILQRPKTSSPSFTASVQVFHMLKKPSNATVKEPPYEDYPPSESGHHSGNTMEDTLISSSQATPSLMSSRHLTRPCKAPICDARDSHFKTDLLQLHTASNPTAPPSDSVGDININIAFLDPDPLQLSRCRRIDISSR
jgi:hypothetical protein